MTENIGFFEYPEVPSGPIEFPLPKGAEPVECDGCSLVYREDEVFDGLCHHCYFLMEEELEDYELEVHEAMLAELADRENDDSKLRF